MPGAGARASMAWKTAPIRLRAATTGPTKCFQLAGRSLETRPAVNTQASGRKPVRAASGVISSTGPE